MIFFVFSVSFHLPPVVPFDQKGKWCVEHLYTWNLICILLPFPLFILVYSIPPLPFFWHHHKYSWLSDFYFIIVRVFRVRKLLELQSKLVNILWICTHHTQLAKSLCYFLTQYEHLFNGAGSIHYVHYSYTHITFPYHWLLLICCIIMKHHVCICSCPPREGSRSSSTYCHFTKCFVLNWWRSPFHHGWGFVHGWCIYCAFCCHIAV